MKKSKFSDRIGITKPNEIQIDRMDANLRNSIWNLLLNNMFSGRIALSKSRVEFIFERFLKLPQDEVPQYRARDIMKGIFYHDNFPWWQVYNLIEFIVENPLETIGTNKSDKFVAEVNRILEEDTSGYRFINHVLAPITNATEIESIEKSIQSTNKRGFSGAETHLKTAIELLAKKPKPDYRNSIKESISAIESIVKQLVGEEGGGLDKALGKLDTQVKFHGGFKSGLLNLYGYTSSEDGIRHAILKEKDVGFDEAKYMLVTCSAFVNFIIEKAAKIDLLTSSIEK